MVGPAAKRDAVAHLRKVLGMSERRACTLVAHYRRLVGILQRMADNPLQDQLAPPAVSRRFGCPVCQQSA
jgi:putative transposase